MLALIKNKKGQILLHKAYDAVKKEMIYRPLGGRIEFHEFGKSATAREIAEGIEKVLNVD